MKNTLSILLALILSTTSLLAYAGGSAPAATCYPIPHGENGQGSTNSLYLPHLYTHNYWNFSVMVTNTSDKYVNVKLNFKDNDGLPYIPQTFYLYGGFNADNSPLLLASGGAILKPGRTAKIAVLDDNTDDDLTGTVTWQADSCIEKALIVSVRSQYSVSERLGSTLMFLNDGQPF